MNALNWAEIHGKKSFNVNVVFANVDHRDRGRSWVDWRCSGCLDQSNQVVLSISNANDWCSIGFLESRKGLSSTVQGMDLSSTVQNMDFKFCSRYGLKVLFKIWTLKYCSIYGLKYCSRYGLLT